MGQLHSESIPEAVGSIHEEIRRQAKIMTEIASLTYDEFQRCMSDLNLMSKHCTDGNGKLLVFAVKKGTDSTVLWKGTVRVACVKFDPETKHIDTYRLLNLTEFLRVFNALKCQFLAAQHSFLNKGALEGKITSLDSSTIDTSGSGLRQLTAMTATMLLEEVDNAALGLGERLNECCICLERKPDVMLPCAHSYCLSCIEQWNVNNKTCPICRETLDSTDNTWIISDAPESQEINEVISETLQRLASP